jgi:hypothetical protein
MCWCSGCIVANVTSCLEAACLASLRTGGWQEEEVADPELTAESGPACGRLQQKRRQHYASACMLYPRSLPPAVATPADTAKQCWCSSTAMRCWCAMLMYVAAVQCKHTLLLCITAEHHCCTSLVFTGACGGAVPRGSLRCCCAMLCNYR